MVTDFLGFCLAWVSCLQKHGGCHAGIDNVKSNLAGDISQIPSLDAYKVFHILFTST